MIWGDNRKRIINSNWGLFFRSKVVVFELGLLYSCWEGWRQRKEPNILICLVTQPPVLLLVNSNSNIQESHLLKISRNFPGDPVVNTALLLWEAQVQSLVRELRSRMPRGTAKKKKISRV